MTQSRGHGDKLPTKGAAAIAALLVEPNFEAAAATAGVHPNTIRAWLRNRPEFVRQLQAAAWPVVTLTTAQLVAGCTEAVAVLRAELAGARAGDRIRAADALLSHYGRALELVNISQRVAKLEELVQGQTS